MLSQPFEKPVCVWVGLGFPRQINSVVDAYQFAMDYCGNSPEQRAAIRACKADVDRRSRCRDGPQHFRRLCQEKGPHGR